MKIYDAWRTPGSEKDSDADNAAAQARVEKHQEAANHVRMTVTGNAANARADGMIETAVHEPKDQRTIRVLRKTMDLRSAPFGMESMKPPS